MEQENNPGGEHEEAWPAIPSDLGQGPVTGPLAEKRAYLWALVLNSRSIPCRVEPDGSGWHLLVPAAFHSVALEELRLFEEENRNWPPPVPPARPLAENTLTTLSVLILLATFHNLTQLDTTMLGRPAPDWIDIGSAKVSRILDGEWWRLVTALTLHADWLHLIGNLTIGGFFLIFLCRELGSGLAWSLLLSAGILGNWANAHFRLPTHSSVGASTMVFAAVGILASLSLVRYRHHRQRRWPLPAAAALALLALLGSEGKRTDLGAHFFGFLFGGGLGLAAEFLVARFGRPGRATGFLLALASAVVVVVAWWMAVKFSI